MRRKVMGLGPFLTSLEGRLDELSAEQLRQIMLEHGSRIPAEERVDFLRLFETQGTGTGHDDPDLLHDAKSFAADIARGTYVEGYGYDPDYGDYRAFGDETWTIEADELLDRAGAAFLTAQVTLARDAYRVLLEAISREDEEGFPGAGTPEELVRSNLGEAKLRYLRSIWESEPVPTRVAALVGGADSLGYLGGDPSLAALDATRREPLPDLDHALPDLIAALREIHPDDLRFGAQARRLMAEATQRHRGVDGLADLARTPGPRQAEAYRDWVDALAGAGRIDDAEQAAREALRELDPYGEVQGWLGERLAALTLARDDGAALLAARRDAWHADPMLHRLLAFVEVATALGRRDEVLTLEAGCVTAGPLAQRPGLAASLLLLAGRVDDASKLMGAAQTWEHRGHPGVVVVPFLLIGGSGAVADPRWTGLLLSTVLVETLSSQRAGPGQRRQWLDDARTHVDSRIAAAVGGQQRSSYQQVAELAAACAEALALADGVPAARTYLDGLHDRYPRHTSFRRELRSAATESPLL